MTRGISLIFIMLVLGFAVACIVTSSPTPYLPTTGASPSGLGTSPAIDTETSALSSTPEGSAQGNLTITGTVIDVSLSARVIMLMQPVQGIDIVALTEETQILNETGDEIALQSIAQGMQIQVAGETGSSGTLIATQIVLLGQ